MNDIITVDAVWVIVIAACPNAVFFLQQVAAVLRLRRQMEAAR